MHQGLFKKLGATAAVALCLAVAPASAAGLLGERYVALEYGQTFTESDAYDDGPGVTLTYNHPFSESVDLGASYRYRSFDGDRADVGDYSDQRLQFLATAFGPPEFDRIWVRLGAGVGYVEHGDDDTTNFSWLGLLGTEYTLGTKGVLQPYVGWSDVVNDGDGATFVYGGQLVFDVDDKVAVSFRLEGDHHYNVTLGLGAVARF